MENEQDDKVVRRWEQTKMVEDDRHDNSATDVALIRPRSPDVVQVGPKRRRITNKGQAERSILKPHDMNRRSKREIEIREILE